jgi:transposase
MIGLPSLHALDRSPGPRIWLAADATDMRCSFDRLAERVKSVIGQDPSGNGLFVFRSRRGDRLKILTWDRDGFVLWYKRLEAGVFKLPRLVQTSYWKIGVPGQSPGRRLFDHLLLLMVS